MTAITYGVTWATGDHSIAQTGYDFDTIEEALEIAETGPHKYDGKVDAMCIHFPDDEGRIWGVVESGDPLWDSHGEVEVAS